MRKMLFSFLLIVLLIFNLYNPAHAYTAADKLTRGTINLLISPLEFFQGIADAVDEHGDNIAIAIPVGICYGSWNTVQRAGVGLFEIITFPFPIPADYEPILEEAVFFE